MIYIELHSLQFLKVRKCEKCQLGVSVALKTPIVMEAKKRRIRQSGDANTNYHLL